MLSERKLGFWETGSYFTEKYYQGTGNLVRAVQLQGTICTNHMHAALQFLFEEQALLRSIIVNDQDEVKFEIAAEFDEIPFTIIDNIDDWQELILAELATPFETDYHLWRFSILMGNPNQPTLLISMHQAICDEASFIGFIRTLLEYYNIVHHDKNLHVMPIDMPSAIENLIPETPSFEDFLERENYPEGFEPKVYPYAAEASFPDRYTQHYFVYLENEILEKLQQQCQQHKIHLSAAVAASLLMAASRHEEGELSTTIRNVMNLRPLTQPITSDLTLGCYMSTIDTLHPHITQHDSLWRLAKDYQQQLTNQLPQSACYPCEFPVDYFDDSSGAIHASQRDYFPAAFRFSFSGELNLPTTYDDIKVVDIFGGNSRQAGDYIISLNAHIFNNQLLLYFHYTQPLVDDLWVESFADTMLEALQACVSHTV